MLATWRRGKAEYPLRCLERPGCARTRQANEDQAWRLSERWPSASGNGCLAAGGPAIDILRPTSMSRTTPTGARGTRSRATPCSSRSRGGRARRRAGDCHRRQVCTASAIHHLDRPAREPGGELAKGYHVLAQVAPLILERQGLGKMTAVLVDKEAPRSKVRLGDYLIRGPVRGARSRSKCARGSPGRSRGRPIHPVGPRRLRNRRQKHGVYFESATDPTQAWDGGGRRRPIRRRSLGPGRRLNGDETPEWKALGSRATATPSRRSSCTATTDRCFAYQRITGVASRLQIGL